MKHLSYNYMPGAVVENLIYKKQQQSIKHALAAANASHFVKKTAT